MKHPASVFTAIAVSFLLVHGVALAAQNDEQPHTGLLVGWGAADVTPEEPVVVQGQFHARVSEGVMDPLTATALVFESLNNGESTGRAAMVSCDFSAVSDCIRDAVREHLRSALPELDPMSIFFSATHTHTGPATYAKPRYSQADTEEPFPYGVDLGVMPTADYVAFAAERMAAAIIQAWNSRAPGGIGFGLGHAVVGRNRLMAYADGTSRMYGKTDDPDFRNVEGYEDHSVNLLFTYDRDSQLTGVVVNLACPSQVSEHLFEISADFWHETRQELRKRLGAGVQVLGQASAAGDQSPHIRIEQRAEERMWKLAGRTQREAIGNRIANAVMEVLPCAGKEIDWNPALIHRVETLDLIRRPLSEQDAQNAASEREKYQKEYEALLRDLEAHPEKREENRWYVNITRAYRRMKREDNVMRRFEEQQTQPTLPFEVHVLRLGDIAFATNPFELYLDYGMQIKGRSKATQTFLVQLAGPGSYLPTPRSIAGGAYGAVPASTEVGPESGQILVNWTINTINGMFEE
ncbi:MAG TPA: hypothetical protein PLF51_14825 [Candidatus Hydrogenedentes bacterium]|nr:hypothetical protein [Candidatus Hydrogenedentota bacterium]